MRASALTVLAVVAGLVAASQVAAHGAAAPQPCSTTKAGSADVWRYCGPARATLTFGGKQHVVSGGRCGVASGSGVTGWGLAVGKYTVPPAKPKFAYVGIAWVGKPPKAGTYTKGEFVVTFHLPGKTYSVIGSPLGTPAMTTKVTAGAKKGTFTGVLNGGKQPVTGTWNC